MHSGTLRLWAVIASVGFNAGCAKPTLRALPAPNPNGCYVMVFEQPGYLGVRDVWNGPARWSSLESLQRTRPGGWRNQIRSLRVGPAANVTIFTDSRFSGQSQELPAASDHPELDRVMSGRIESVQITCK